MKVDHAFTADIEHRAFAHISNVVIWLVKFQNSQQNKDNVRNFWVSNHRRVWLQTTCALHIINHTVIIGNI